MNITAIQGQKPASEATSRRYARAIEASKKARWDIDRDVIRGRTLERDRAFLPPSLTKARELDFLNPDQARLFSQIQGRTYAYVFGLVERFINAKVLELSARHALGDQLALEALVRFSDEEIKHQELFRRVEALAADVLPPGYVQTANADDVARAVLGMSTWSVLALTLHIELFTQTHYKQSLDVDADISPLFRDVFRFHWMEESQHAVLDEIELREEDARLSPAERDGAVDDFIALVGAVDALLVTQSTADADYFLAHAGPLEAGAAARAERAFLSAYRYQYVLSGVEETKLVTVLRSLLSDHQMERIVRALAPLMPPHEAP